MTYWHILPLSLLVTFPVALKLFCSRVCFHSKLPQRQTRLYPGPCPGRQGHSAYPAHTGHCRGPTRLLTPQLFLFFYQITRLPSLEALQRQCYTPLSGGGKWQPTGAILFLPYGSPWLCSNLSVDDISTPWNGQGYGPQKHRPTSGLSK